MNQEERIDKYHNNQMSEQELTRFKAEMAANPELAEAVDLQKDIADFFDQKEPALEAMLSNEGERHFSSVTAKQSRPWWSWFIPILLLIVGLGIWWWQGSYNATSSTINETIPTDKNDSPLIVDTIKALPPVSPDEEVLPDLLLKEASDSKEAKSPIKTETPPLIASLDPEDFKPNPILEGLMAEKTRNSATNTVVKTPSMDTTFPFNENIFFKIEGITTEKPPYRLVIYSNREVDFENDYRVLSHALAGTPHTEKFEFSYTAKIPFTKGLYYLLLLSEEKEDILYISRFRVE